MMHFCGGHHGATTFPSKILTCTGDFSSQLPTQPPLNNGDYLSYLPNSSLSLCLLCSIIISISVFVSFSNRPSLDDLQVWGSMVS